MLHKFRIVSLKRKNVKYIYNSFLAKYFSCIMSCYVIVHHTHVAWRLIIIDLFFCGSLLLNFNKLLDEHVAKIITILCTFNSINLIRSMLHALYVG